MYTTSHSNSSLLPYGHSRIKLNTNFNSIHLIRIVFNINAAQYQTGPIHESDNHIFAKIPGGGGGPDPPDPPSGSAHDYYISTDTNSIFVLPSFCSAVILLLFLFLSLCLRGYKTICK